MQSILPSNDLPQKLSQNTVETTSEIDNTSGVRTAVLVHVLPGQAKVISFPRAFLALFSVSFSCVPGLYIAYEAWLKARPRGVFWNSYSHRSHAGRDGLWIKH